MSFRICLIGCGRHSHQVHGPSLRKYRDDNPGVALAAACDLNLAAARTFAADFGFDGACDDVGTMLKQERPDAVSVVLPPGLADSVCIPLLTRGIPLLLEKPPALTCAGLDRLIVAAERGRGPAQVAFNRRHTELLMRVRRILEEHIPPSEIYQIDYDLIRHDRRDPDFSTTAIHALDAILYLSRSPYRRADFSHAELTTLGTGVANLEMRAECESGARIRLSIQPVAGVAAERVAVHARNHTLLLDLPMWGGDLRGGLRHWHEGRLVEEIVEDDTVRHIPLFLRSGFFSENKCFFDAVRFGSDPSLPDLRETRQQVALMEAMRHRIRSMDKI